MIKFIVDEQPTEKGVHLIHNGDANCQAQWGCELSGNAKI